MIDLKSTHADAGTAGTDAALAALQNSLASYEQEKKASATNIVNSVVPEGRSGKHQKRGLLGMNDRSRLASPSASASATPRLGLAPTSAPSSENTVRLQAMRVPIIHLLAIRPTSAADIMSMTHIGKEDLDAILSKVGKQIDGKWTLADKAYKDLDVWDFAYTSQEDRQAAIDSAIKAYDRQRLGKEEMLWQMLLPKDERGKGTILSRLHLGGGAVVNRSLTPHYQPSPLPDLDEQNDSKAASSANTPRLGPAGTPKVGAKKAAGDMTKRLFSKDPQKERKVAEARERKRKEREAAASDKEDRPTKRQTTKKVNPKVKSAEIVHSSDEDDEDGEVKEPPARAPARASPATARPTVRPKAKALSASSPDSSDLPAKKAAATDRPPAKARTGTPTTKSSSSPAVKPARPTTGGKSTPQPNGLSAPQTQHKSALSPSKSQHRPNAPSPLGAARPRVSSDVSDRSAIGVQRARQGADAPKGLGITNGIRKRHDTVTSTESLTSSSSERQRKDTMDPDKARKPAVNGTHTSKTAYANQKAGKTENGLKRRAEEPSVTNGTAAPAPKHRKTESMSSQSQQSHASTTATAQSTARTSPEATFDGSSSDSAASILDTITFNQGVSVAEKFRDHYYPVYAKMYDGMAARQAKGEVIPPDEREQLWKMHGRLDQMKREIRAASQRENGRE